MQNYLEFDGIVEKMDPTLLSSCLARLRQMASRDELTIHLSAAPHVRPDKTQEMLNIRAMWTDTIDELNRESAAANPRFKIPDPVKYTPDEMNLGWHARCQVIESAAVRGEIIVTGRRNAHIRETIEGCIFIDHKIIEYDNGYRSWLVIVPREGYEGFGRPYLHDLVLGRVGAAGLPVCWTDPLFKLAEVAPRSSIKCGSHNKPKRGGAGKLLSILFPDGVPARDDMPNAVLIQNVCSLKEYEDIPRTHRFSDDTILRAAGRKR